MRIAQKSKVQKINSLDNFMIIVGFIEPIVIIPQVIQIFSTQNASGLSLVTWIPYIVVSLLWIYWGLRRRLKPIYIPQTAWLVFEIIIIYGIIKYS